MKTVDHFQRLGLAPHLNLQTEALDQARDEAGREYHPDQGGDPAVFAAVNEAHALLGSPARRCRHLHEVLFPNETIERQSSLPPELGDLFMSIGPALAQADELLDRKKQARTALAQALLSNDLNQCQESLEEQIAAITQASNRRIERFSEIDETLEGSTPEEARPLLLESWSVLSFLEKWQGQLKERWASLVI